MDINTPEKVEEYYKRENITEKYLSKRYTDPIYKAIHNKQVEVLNKFLAQNNPQTILELAPGPARVTAELNCTGGKSLDSSQGMLDIAKERMQGKDWEFIQGDAFNLNFEKDSHDLIFTFRFLFHFKKEEREKLYKSIHTILKPGGTLIFDAINIKKAKTIRKIVGKKGYEVYDKLYHKHELITELRENGFDNIQLIPAISHFWPQMFASKFSTLIKRPHIGAKAIKKLEKKEGKNPYEWIAICQKI